DIPLDTLSLPHQADFIRAYLLKHYGGLYVDADCIVMRSLSPIQEMVEQYGFVGYREPQGDVSCNFMASEPGGAVINAHYEAVCETLRSRRRRGWLDLCSVPLNKATARFPGKNFLLPTQAVMPLGWSESEQLYRRGSDEEHERYFQHDAFCYMLANQTIRTLPQTQTLYSMSEEQILNENYFISFLLRSSLMKRA
ncbi:MAG TPA: glycosyltransferase, partial [Ktedonobacteraceae bacterium]|nr:glycosyltransferase [Ktedonobacteraceae bacterium]